MTFELKLVEGIVIERTEFRFQAPKCPDQRELRFDLDNDAAEPHFFGKLEARLSFTLHLRQRISRGQKIGV
jgi:hypothetical protein